MNDPAQRGNSNRFHTRGDDWTTLCGKERTGSSPLPRRINTAAKKMVGRSSASSPLDRSRLIATVVFGTLGLVFVAMGFASGSVPSENCKLRFRWPVLFPCDRIDDNALANWTRCAGEQLQFSVGSLFRSIHHAVSVEGILPRLSVRHWTSHDTGCTVRVPGTGPRRVRHFIRPSLGHTERPRGRTNKLEEMYQCLCEMLPRPTAQTY